MDSNSQENSDTKAEFRKPVNDAANRKYRRRSPVGGSSPSSDGSPQHDRNNSPARSRKNIANIAHDKQKKDDGRDSSGRGGESYKHYDRQSSRNYDRYDDYSKRDRHVDDYDRGNSKSSFRSSRDSRDMSYCRGGKDPRYRDYPKDVDKYHREKPDASGNRSRDKSTSDREGTGRRHGNVEERDRSGHHLNEASQRDSNELDKRYADRDRHSREPEKHSDVVSSFSSKDKHSDSKKPKLSSWDSTGPGTNGTSEKACVMDSDIDAAKVAAMKAAELVNKNLVGTGFMSADQKKKLLWGNKKSTTTEEPAHRWNSAIFGDRERQEKFNKLMSLRLCWPIVGCERRAQSGSKARRPECGKTTRTASIGIGETVHSWIASERWQDCWTWSLEVSLRRFLSGGCIMKFVGTLFYCVKKPSCKTLRLSFHLIGACWSLVMTKLSMTRFCFHFPTSSVIVKF